MTGSITVGSRTIEIDEARRILGAYTSADSNRRDLRPYAYPAYDQMDSGTDPSLLSDGDLLAPQLLNVQVKLVAFYGLQRLRPRLERALADDRLATPLVGHTEAEIDETVGALYSPLDDEQPHGVRGTTLSKVLHRKRPQAVVLHDANVRACYLGSQAVPRVRERSWADYMVLLTKAIRHDLVEQRAHFEELARGLGKGVVLTDVRILDILAWSLGRDAGPKTN